MARTRAKVEVHPLTPRRWDDFVRLFGEERGAWGGCWCMWWRMPSKEFDAGARHKGAGNREGMKRLVEMRRTPGLLAYLDGEPAGWVSVAPREEFGRIERSRVLGPVDDVPVWSVVCFYMDRRQRGRGVGTALLEAAIDHARSRGARWLEAYPIDPSVKRTSNSDAYTGVVPMFERAGFKEVARRKDARPIMRKELRQRARRAAP